MELLPLLCIVSLSLAGLTEGAGVLPDVPLNETVGRTVTFTTTVTPTETPFFAVSWKFGDKEIFLFNVENKTSPEYEGRVTVFMSTGSLELRNVALNDTGEYRLIIIPVGEAIIEGRTRLNVYEPVSNVAVTASSTDLVEFNSSVRLSCSSSSGSSPSFLWLNSSSEVTASDPRVQLTDGGSTLTVVNVSRYDQGPFRCHVFNPVSNGTSGAVSLSISFGPENITLTSPTQEYCKRGSNVTLSCSAVSKPSAQFYWFLDGDNLSDVGPELRLINVQSSQSGNYSCQAFNQKTARYGDSEPSPLSVLEAISDASVTSSTSPPVEGNALNLTCEAAGSVFTRTWMKDDSELIQTDNATFHDRSRVLSFSSLNKRHSGEYYCEISNPVSTDGAKYIMVVNYGPGNVQITGPSEIHVDETLTLICSAESTPSASFTWKLNGTEIHDSSVFTQSITDVSDGGMYSCQATNNVTGKTSTAVHGLTVTVIQSKTPSCSAGCIAGIVIAVIVVLCALAAGLLIYQRKYRKAPKGSSRDTITGGEGMDNTTYSGSQELNYAVISFSQKKDGGTDRLELQSSPEYAEVKVNNNRPPPSSPPTYDAHLQRTRTAAPQPGANGTQLYAQVRKN